MSEQDCQTANSKTTAATTQFGYLVVNCVSVYDLWSAPCTQTCKYFFTSAHGQTRGKLKLWGNKDSKYTCLWNWFLKMYCTLRNTCPQKTCHKREETQANHDMLMGKYGGISDVINTHKNQLKKTTNKWHGTGKWLEEWWNENVRTPSACSVWNGPTYLNRFITGRRVAFYTWISAVRSAAVIRWFVIIILWHVLRIFIAKIKGYGGQRSR
jgi:hypothetical protein